MNEYYSPKEVSNKLNVNLNTVYHWIKKEWYFNTRQVGGLYFIPSKEVQKILKNGYPKKKKS